MKGWHWGAPTRVFGGGGCALGRGDRWRWRCGHRRRQRRLPLPWASSSLVGGGGRGCLPGLASTTFSPPLLSSFPPLLSFLTSSFPFPSFGRASIGLVTWCSRSREVGDGNGRVAVPTGTARLDRGGGATPVGVAPWGLGVVVLGGAGVVQGEVVVVVELELRVRRLSKYGNFGYRCRNVISNVKQDTEFTYCE